MGRLRRAVAAGAVIGVFAAANPVSAQTSRCFENGDIVTFDGVASAGATRSQWLLNLSRPICVARGKASRGADISTIRIIGTPPPLGIPLELMGKLMLGRSAVDSAMYVALVVIRGRKIRTAQSIAPAPRSAPAQPSVPAPRVAPSPHVASARVAPAPEREPAALAAENCNAPPYGGTPADYHAFVRRFGRIVKPDKILADVCNAKFGNSPRDQLHRLGLTDAKINSENTEDLAADTIVALKTLVNKLE